MTAFDYPAPGVQRKHGPRGYTAYARYLPWLRDEFEFRCVYCLAREQWLLRLGDFVIDHFVPVAIRPADIADYENLVYACAACNTAKGRLVVPEPTKTLVAGSVVVQEDGQLAAHTLDASVLIDALGLNDQTYVRFRRMWLTVLHLAQVHDPATYRELLRHPDDLPDLARLRPPGGNSRPEGIAKSHFTRRERGEIEATY